MTFGTGFKPPVFGYWVVWAAAAVFRCLTGLALGPCFGPFAGLSFGPAPRSVVLPKVLVGEFKHPVFGHQKAPFCVRFWAVWGRGAAVLCRFERWLWRFVLALF